MDPIPAELARAAGEELRRGVGIERLARDSGQVGEPIPVQHPPRSITHWFVPVVVADRLAGYFLFDSQLRPVGYSSFLRGRDEPAVAPEAATWTDPARIRETAVGSRPGLQAEGEPYLTYDGAPARLAWAVRVRSPAGDALVFVTGEFAYTAPSTPGSTQ